MENSPYRKAGNPNPEYKVIEVYWSDSDVRKTLEQKLNAASKEGWRPILYSTGGRCDTVILERYQTS